MRVDLDQVTAIIREAAEAEILPRFRALQSHEIRTKTHERDFVTDADVGAEKILTDRLSALLPGSVVVGEESVHADPKLMRLLTGEAPVWVLDPVDGTGNFAHGRKRFAVIVALVHKGETVAGWIHDPLHNETAVAEKGGGAVKQGKPLSAHRAAEPVDLKTLHGSIGFRLSRETRSRFGNLVVYGSAAHIYLAMAQGVLSFAAFRRLMPWDHAAGVLLLQEAGGFARLFDGSDYVPNGKGRGLLLAGSEAVWTAVHDVTYPEFPDR